MKYITLSAVVAVLATTAPSIVAFSTRPFGTTSSYRRSALNMSTENVAAPVGFIESELRGAAMKLHTRKQAPKEGQAEEDSSTTEEQQPYITTHDDYLQFLVDSLHVYQAMEEIVNDKDELVVFRNTGLERTKPLQEDIEFMVKKYGLKRPEVGPAGREYADELRRIAARGAIPEFICHYYNFYFAHTAGGRMIGKQMSALLLDKKTLEFYKVRTSFVVMDWRQGNANCLISIDFFFLKSGMGI
jgi:heme oxygenase